MREKILHGFSALSAGIIIGMALYDTWLTERQKREDDEELENEVDDKWDEDDEDNFNDEWYEGGDILPDLDDESKEPLKSIGNLRRNGEKPPISPWKLTDNQRVHEGDIVQWKSGEVYQFGGPRKVARIVKDSDLGTYVFVEGQDTTGIPIEQIVVLERRSCES